MTREERIKQYAHDWYRIRLAHGIKGNSQTDWEKAEHIVNGEDWAEQMEAHHVAENISKGS